jgi:hypothetical protein
MLAIPTNAGIVTAALVQAQPAGEVQPVPPTPPAPITPAVPVPVEVIVQAAPPPVTIPIGDIMSGLLGYVWVGLGALIAYSFRKLPPQVNAMFMTMRVEQLLKQAIAFGINQTPGAVAGKTIEINTANPVLRWALSYARTHGAALVKQFAGTPAELAEKIWSRLDLASDVAKPNFVALAAEIDISTPRRAA